MTQTAETPARTWKMHLQEKVGLYVSLTTALIAALTGISSLLMGSHGGRAASEMVLANDQWAYYQAKSIKGYILDSEINLTETIGKPVRESSRTKLAEIEAEKKKIRADAEAHVAKSKRHGQLSGILSMAVMLFQIAIANAAIAALSKKWTFWLFSVGLALVGVGYFVYFFIA